MPDTTLTIQNNVPSVTLSTAQTEGSTPLTTPDADYSAPTYTVDNAALGSIQVLSANGPESFVPTGSLGTATVTATSTSSVSGQPDITGTLAITIEGPVPDGLEITGTPVAAS